MTRWRAYPMASVVAALLATVVDAYTGPMMGVQTDCDDAKSRLEIDWDYANDFSPFTCNASEPFPVDPSVEELYYAIPNLDARHDVVGHVCMNETIVYADVPPLRGDHRPNWPVYGEYLYVPPQRWLHNLEHGSIILLYHPCVDVAELQKLRTLITGCLYRHIITPYNKLSKQRPLALVGWGAKLEMARVNADSVVAFVRKHTHIAPEDLAKHGLYDLHLIRKAAVVSTKRDATLCPQYANKTAASTAVPSPSSTPSPPIAAGEKDDDSAE